MYMKPKKCLYRCKSTASFLANFLLPVEEGNVTSGIMYVNMHTDLLLVKLSLPGILCNKIKRARAIVVLCVILYIVIIVYTVSSNLVYVLYSFAFVVGENCLRACCTKPSQ